MWRHAILLAAVAIGCSPGPSYDCDCVLPDQVELHLAKERSRQLVSITFSPAGCAQTRRYPEDCSDGSTGCTKIIVDGNTEGGCLVDLAFTSLPHASASTTFHFVPGCCGGYEPDRGQTIDVDDALPDAATGG